MRSTFLSVGLLAWLVSMVSATALTYKLAANEKACFYARANKENSKIAFYFAVRGSRLWSSSLRCRCRY
jgi:hypothetical protein